MSNENPKPYIKKELERRGIETKKASSEGNFKLAFCWDSECGSNDCSFNIYTGLWQCYTHKGDDETQSGNFVKGLAIADEIPYHEEWEQLNNLYPDFNEPPPRGVSKDPKKKKSFSSVDLRYVNKTHEILFDSTLARSQNDLSILFKRQAVTRSTLKAVKIGFDPEINKFQGRYTIPIRSRMNDRWVNLKYYDPKSSKWKYLFYTAYEDENKKHKLKFNTNEMFPLVLQYDEDVLTHQLSYENIIIVEGLWTALCLIPFCNRQNFGVLAPIAGANSVQWLDDAAIRGYFQMKNLYVLYDIDVTGIKAEELIARRLKHKAENNVYKLNLFPMLNKEKYIYGFDNIIGGDSEGKITNADPVNWIKDRAAVWQIPLDGKDWSDEFLNQIWIEFQGMLEKAEEIKEEAVYRDNEGDIIVDGGNLKAIADLHLDIFHTEEDLTTLLYEEKSTSKGQMLKQPADETAFQPYKKDGIGSLQNDIVEFCNTLKTTEPKTGLTKSSFCFNAHTIEQIYKFEKWKLTIQAGEDRLIKPELNPEFPKDLRNLITGKTHYVDFTDYLIEKKFEAMHEIGRTPNFFTKSQLTFNPDWQIKVTGELIYKYVIEDWWPNEPDSQKFFWEYVGYICYGRNPLHKILYVYGVPGSGRSQLGIIFEALVGENRFWISELNALSGRFETSVWTHKKLICFTDARFDRFQTRNEQGVIQTLISGSGGEGRMRSEHKGKDTQNVKLFDANMALFSNGIIAITDITRALEDRIRLLNMTHSYRGTFATEAQNKKMIIEMARKLVKEDKSMQVLQKQGFKYLPELLYRKDFIEPKNTATARTILKERSKPKLKFVEWLIFDQDDPKHHYQSVRNLYSLYLYHCLDNNVKRPVGKNSFIGMLVEYYAAITHDEKGYVPNFPSVPPEKRKQKAVLRNVRVKPEWIKFMEADAWKKTKEDTYGHYNLKMKTEF